MEPSEEEQESLIDVVEPEEGRASLTVEPMSEYATTSSWVTGIYNPAEWSLWTNAMVRLLDAIDADVKRGSPVRHEVWAVEASKYGGGPGRWRPPGETRDIKVSVRDMVSFLLHSSGEQTAIRAMGSDGIARQLAEELGERHIHRLGYPRSRAFELLVYLLVEASTGKEGAGTTISDVDFSDLHYIAPRAARSLGWTKSIAPYLRILALGGVLFGEGAEMALFGSVPTPGDPMSVARGGQGLPSSPIRLVHLTHLSLEDTVFADPWGINRVFAACFYMTDLVYIHVGIDERLRDSLFYDTRNITHEATVLWQFCKAIQRKPEAVPFQQLRVLRLQYAGLEFIPRHFAYAVRTAYSYLTPPGSGSDADGETPYTSIAESGGKEEEEMGISYETRVSEELESADYLGNIFHELPKHVRGLHVPLVPPPDLPYYNLLYDKGITLEELYKGDVLDAFHADGEAAVDGLPFLELFPRLSHLDLRGNFISWTTTDLGNPSPIAFVALWMHRALLRSYDPMRTRALTYASYEHDVDFVDFQPMGRMDDDVTDELADVNRHRRVWRYVHTSLDLRDHAIVLASKGMLDRSRRERVRDKLLTTGLHMAEFQALLTHGHFTYPTQIPTQTAVLREQLYSLFWLTGAIRDSSDETLVESSGGYAPLLMEKGIGLGRSFRDGRSISIYLDPALSAWYADSSIFNRRTTILRTMDRPLDPVTLDRWSAENRRLLSYHASGEGNLDRVMAILDPGVLSANITQVSLTEIPLRDLTWRGEEITELPRKGVETGSMRSMRRHVMRTILSLPNLAYLHLEPDDPGDQEVLMDFMGLLLDQRALLRFFARYSKDTEEWPLQKLQVLRLTGMGLETLPVSLLPTNFNAIREMELDATFEEYVRYGGEGAGHVYGDDGSGDTNALILVELFPSLNHLDLRGNNLMATYARSDETTRAKAAHRAGWLDEWLNRAVAAARDYNQNVSSTRTLSLPLFASLEASVDTSRYLWDEPDAPHLTSHSTLDLRDNPAKLWEWDRIDREVLADVRLRVYVSHIGYNDDRADMVWSRFLATNTFEVPALVHSRMPRTYGPFNSGDQMIDDEASYEIPPETIARTREIVEEESAGAILERSPVRTRGIAIRMDGDMGAAMAIHRIDDMMATIPTPNLFARMSPRYPDYGMGVEPEWVYGWFYPSPGTRAEIKAYLARQRGEREPRRVDPDVYRMTPERRAWMGMTRRELRLRAKRRQKRRERRGRASVVSPRVRRQIQWGGGGGEDEGGVTRVARLPQPRRHPPPLLRQEQPGMSGREEQRRRERYTRKRRERHPIHKIRSKLDDGPPQSSAPFGLLPTERRRRRRRGGGLFRRRRWHRPPVLPAYYYYAVVPYPVHRRPYVWDPRLEDPRYYEPYGGGAYHYVTTADHIRAPPGSSLGPDPDGGRKIVGNHVTVEDALWAADHLNVDLHKAVGEGGRVEGVDYESRLQTWQFALQAEAGEHGSGSNLGPVGNVTDDSLSTTGLIAMAHFKEDPTYYHKLYLALEPEALQEGTLVPGPIANPGALRKEVIDTVNRDDGTALSGAEATPPAPVGAQRTTGSASLDHVFQ